MIGVRHDMSQILRRLAAELLTVFVVILAVGVYAILHVIMWAVDVFAEIPDLWEHAKRDCGVEGDSFSEEAAK